MIFNSIVTLAEGVGSAITDEMTLKHTSLQLSSYPKPKALICLSQKKEKTGSSIRKESIKCISSSRNMVERYGGLMIPRTTLMEVRQWCSSTVPHRRSPSMELSTICSKDSLLYVFIIFRMNVFFSQEV